ncbi:endonuclease domain-containing protein [Actinoplanes sp. NPDC026623]|uniref:endonuclease domain-containing protein n=1 Tax=Actinoplanes sp. NPDC026623 TaxID=3155610 RepID=UPI0033FB205D
MVSELRTDKTQLHHNDSYDVSRRTRDATKDGDRVWHAQVLRERYRLTPSDYDSMMDERHGARAICGKAESVRGRGGAPRRLAVDHDHRTGTIRQLQSRHLGGRGEPRSVPIS